MQIRKERDDERIAGPRYDFVYTDISFEIGRQIEESFSTIWCRDIKT